MCIEGILRGVCVCVCLLLPETKVQNVIVRKEGNSVASITCQMTCLCSDRGVAFLRNTVATEKGSDPTFPDGESGELTSTPALAQALWVVG